MIADGDLVLAEARKRLGIDLRPLVAACGVFAHPSTFEAVRRLNPHGAWFPGFRRMRKGERKGTTVDGVVLDDNTRANFAIKRAVFGTHVGVESFHCCHVWPATCYDPRYHTCIANIVLLPAAVAGLSDHDQGVAACLRFRAWDLFGWKPDEADAPFRPDGYPLTEAWLLPPKPTAKVQKALERLGALRSRNP